MLLHNNATTLLNQPVTEAECRIPQKGLKRDGALKGTHITLFSAHCSSLTTAAIASFGWSFSFALSMSQVTVNLPLHSAL